MADNTEPIPQPPGLPLLGNINDINPEFPLGSMINMADKYGVCSTQSYSTVLAETTTDTSDRKFTA